jgi:hypothetical protein
MSGRGGLVVGDGVPCQARTHLIWKSSLFFSPERGGVVDVGIVKEAYIYTRLEAL